MINPSHSSISQLTDELASYQLLIDKQAAYLFVHMASLSEDEKSALGLELAECVETALYIQALIDSLPNQN